MSDSNHDDAMADDIPLSTLPLDAWHRAHGGRMVPFAGYEMPIQYSGEAISHGGGIVAEHNWTRESASLFDVSHMGQLGVSGPDAGAALEALLPGGVTSLKEGRMRYSMLLNEAGGILDDLMVTNTGDQYALVVNGACKWDDIAHLREHLPDEITLTHYADNALLALQGPKAADVLSALVPAVSDLTFMRACFANWSCDGDDVPLWISRAGYTGEDGFEIAVPGEYAARLADALTADDRVEPAGLGARDSLRLEAGLPLYGHDMTDAADPVSADLTFALTKKRRETGGWMGHEAVMTVLENGPAQRRTGLLLDGRMPAREGADVYAGDTKIGTVTSGGFSPTLGRPIAMAMIDTHYTADGTALECEVRGKRLPATTAPMPFVPHRYFRES